MSADLESIKYLYSSLFSFLSKVDDFLIENKIISSKDISEKYCFQFYKCYRCFVYSVVKADNHVSFEEIYAIKELFQDDDSFSEIEEHIDYYYEKDYLNDPEQFVELIAKIRTFEIALNKETGEKNHIIPSFFNLFRDTGIYFAGIDDDIDDQEVDAVTSYIAVVQSAYEIVFQKENHNFEEIDIDIQPSKEKFSLKNIDFISVKPSENSTEKLIEELNNLIGLQQVKSEINNLINLVKIMKIRKERGLSIPQKSLHLVFTGNPGTGKTTVARLISEIYCSLGILSKGHLIETDRSGLVAGYVGQTALKVQEIVKKALGGILFIDEAYSLHSKRDSQDYGAEAINTLLKLMEDNRNDLVVIVAGYPDKMNDFIESNPGLKSRFNKYIYFPDYGPEELFKIFEKMSIDHQMHLSDDGKYFAQKGFEKIFEKRTPHFGNGRDVRNIFENTLSNQANRLVEIDNISDLALNELTVDDFRFGIQTYLKNMV